MTEWETAIVNSLANSDISPVANTTFCRGATGFYEKFDPI